MKHTLNEEVNTMRNLIYYVPGSILILMAIIIVALPEILVALVAASIITAGVGALYVGHMIRKSAIEFRNIDGCSWNSNGSGGEFVRSPMFRRWFHRRF